METVPFSSSFHKLLLISLYLARALSGVKLSGRSGYGSPGISIFAPRMGLEADVTSTVPPASLVTCCDTSIIGSSPCGKSPNRSSVPRRTASGDFGMKVGSSVKVALSPVELEPERMRAHYNLGVKYFEYAEKFQHGLLPGFWYNPHGAGEPVNGNIFFGLYFMMTGLHGLHVVAGIVVIAWILRRSLQRQFSAEYHTPVELVGIYWHLVDLIWIYLFPLFYLVG